MSVFVKNINEYPELLGKIGGAPKRLYCRGAWNPELFNRCLAVVGTRRMTQYGKRVTEQIVGEIAAAGVTIVSGFMYGVDATAHRAALKAGGKTITVMPCGIDVVHPEYQADMYQEILDSGGLVVSEYEGTHPAMSWTFPRRNRIVAGLSKATLVVEAGEGSGALITANFAKQYGRKIFAVPNPLTSAVSQGVNQLLKEGAELVDSAEGILQYYGLRRRNAEQRGTTTRKYAELKNEMEKRILRELEKESLQIDELSRKLVMSSSQVGAAISMLQLEGFISEEQGKFYVN